MAKKPKKQKIELDTTTTFVNMNVEGFKWYDPTLEKRLNDRKGMVPQKISRKEYRQMVRGAFAAFAPFIVGMIVVFGLMMVIAYLWLS